MATTAKYTIIEDTRTSLIVKLTKKDNNFSHYRLFFYTGSSGGTAVKDYNYSSSELEKGLRFTGLTEGQTYRIDLGVNNDSTSTQPSIASGNRIGVTIFKKSIMTYQLQFYYQQDEEFLPITTIERSYNGSSWTTIDFDETSKAGVTIDDELAIDKDIYIRITKEANTKVTGWYVATNGTTRSSYSENTSKNTVTYRYEYDSNDYATKVKMRAVFQVYSSGIHYQTFPYDSYSSSQQVVSTYGLYTETNFYSKHDYDIYYPEYQEGRDGIGWNTTANSTTAQYKSGISKTIDATKKEVYELDPDKYIIKLYPAYKNKYTITLKLYNGTSIVETISFYRDSTGTYSLKEEEIKDIWNASPSKDGYELLGYSTTSGGNGVLSYPFEEDFSTSWSFQWKTTVQTYNLYAVWAKYYYASFTLYGKGGFFPDNKDTNYLTNDISTGSIKKVPDLPQPTRDGYELIGWSLDWQTGAAVDYELGAEFEYSESGKSYTLYAVWRKKYHYKVTYYSGDGGAWPDGSTEKVDEKDVYETPYKYYLKDDTPVSNQEGYTFKYWLENNIQYETGSQRTFNFTEENDTIEVKFTAQYLKASSKSVVYINGKAYVPHIYYNGAWYKCEAWIYDEGWKMCIE